MQEFPETAGAKLGERVLDANGAAEPRHILMGVVAADTIEAAGLGGLEFR